MGKINLEDHRLIPADIALAIKLELSLEERLCGVVNPKLTQEPLFIQGKRGNGGFYWGWVDDRSEDQGNFLILGNPAPWIRLNREHDFAFHHSYNSHNAQAEFKFSAYKTVSGQGDEKLFSDCSFTYAPGADIVTPEFGADLLKKRSSRIYGEITESVGEDEKGKFSTVMKHLGDQIPNPLSYMQASQVIEFYKSFVRSLACASPTAAKFVGDKISSLRIC